jgi:hypothetical protein
LKRFIHTAGFALTLLATTSAIAADTSAAGDRNHLPSPLSLPVVTVTIPSLIPVKVGDEMVSVMEQVRLLTRPHSLPVMFVVTPKEGSDDLMPWSLLNTINIRWLSVNASKYPEVAEYLTRQRSMSQNAYALVLPASVEGQQPTIILWRNEVDGELTQEKLEQIYAAKNLWPIPLTAPPLNPAAWNDLLTNADKKVPGAPTHLVILAWHETEPDVLSLMRERILAGVEFVKSPGAPVVELDEDAQPEITSKLLNKTAPATPMLIVFNLVERRVIAIYDPSKVSALTEPEFQAFALANGMPPFLNTRTDVSEAFFLARHQPAPPPPAPATAKQP